MGKKRVIKPSDPLVPPALPAGPPLHLERPGAAAELLGPQLTPERLGRMQGVLAHRTRHLTALVEDIHDPHNVAACVRSCDACGIQDLHIVTTAGAPLRVGRAVSKGANRWLTLRYHGSIEAAAEAIHAAGYLIGATDLGGATPPIPLPEVPIERPLCLAFGNEHAGISQHLRELSDFRVRIPMHGFVESLNISVAFALSMFTLRMKLDAQTGGAGDLDEAARAALLDRWIFAQVKRAPEVLAREIARRAAEADADAG